MRRPTLLVVEDVQDQALLVGIAARNAHPGLRVESARHGGVGIAYLAGEPPFDDRTEHPLPDLIVLDLYMPEVDGFEMLEWIRDADPPVDAPVVVLTSSDLKADEERALELGAASVHRKPTELAELGRTVRTIVEKWIGRGDIIAAHIWEAG